MTAADPFEFAATIGRVLDELRIDYLVGGSVASILFGEPRSTKDLDIMISATGDQVRALAHRLQDDFYIDSDAAVEAMNHRSTFNAIHIETFLRVDFFAAEDQPEVREQFRRGRIVRGVRFYSPEDIIVRKLRWFRMGGEVSDQQWRDVIGVLRVSRDLLDHAYLDRAADAFGVRDLLELARQDAL